MNTTDSKLGLKKTVKMLKWLWVTLAIWAAVEILLVLIVYPMSTKAFWILTAIACVPGSFYSGKVIHSFPYRRRQYLSLREIYTSRPEDIKKSILIKMQVAPCTRTSAKMLCEEFNIDLSEDLS